jgi:hypothetical protein
MHESAATFREMNVRDVERWRSSQRRRHLVPVVQNRFRDEIAMWR